MLPVGFEPKISAGERPQTYALDRTAAGTGQINIYTHIKLHRVSSTINFEWGLSVYQTS